MSNKIKTIQKKIVTKDETIAGLERQNRMLFEVKENQKQVILRLIKENDKLNKEIELLINGHVDECSELTQEQIKILKARLNK